MSFNWATLFLLISLQGFAQLPMDSLKGEQFSLHKTSNLKIQSADFTGSFSIVKGRIGYDFDSLKVEGFDLVVDVSSLDLIDPVMTKHAKSSDFFDVKNHPSITFWGESFLKNDSTYKVTGKMTAKGTTRETEIAFKVLSAEKEAIQIQADFIINRSDFNIGLEDAVSNEVSIHAELIAYKKKK
jgi:polyisoprenoid-binding protein YceI